MQRLPRGEQVGSMYDPEAGYPVIVPYLLYPDLREAIGWLADVFGFSELLRYTRPGGDIVHVELERSGHVVMLGLKGGRFGEVSSLILIFVEDVDATCARAVSVGGAVVDDAHDQPWGLRQAVIADPWGQRWEATEYVRAVPPAVWGAQVKARPRQRSQAQRARQSGAVPQEEH
jgi:uncharacterized glyoxalase superfamily protein PhnB